MFPGILLLTLLHFFAIHSKLYSKTSSIILHSPHIFFSRGRGVLVLFNFFFGGGRGSWGVILFFRRVVLLLSWLGEGGVIFRLWIWWGGDQFLIKVTLFIISFNCTNYRQSKVLFKNLTRSWEKIWKIYSFFDYYIRTLLYVIYVLSAKQWIECTKSLKIYPLLVNVMDKLINLLNMKNSITK